MSEAWLVTWGATYLLHSTLLLGAAWLVARCGRPRATAAREWMWRAALLAGLTSATAQSLIGVRPLTGRVALPAQLEAEPLARIRPSAATRERALPRARSASGPERAWDRAAVPPTASTASTALDAARGDARSRVDAPVASAPAGGLAVSPDERPARAVPTRTPAWLALGTGLWMLVAAARAGHALGRRRPLDQGPWAEELARLVAASGLRRRVRLTVSRRTAVPVALGVLRPEICLPERALHELTPALVRAALAHELGHHARLDPLWLGLAQLVRGSLFLQPLNALAARELARLAELSADGWAVRQTGDRLGLARCLTEVAGWIEARSTPLGACAIVRRGGRLEERVHALLDHDLEPARERLSGVRRAALVATLAVSPLALPGLGADADESPVESPAETPAEAGAEGGAERSAEARGSRAAATLVRRLHQDLDEVQARLAAWPDERAKEAQGLDRRRAELRAELRKIEAALGRLSEPEPESENEGQEAR